MGICRRATRLINAGCLFAVRPRTRFADQAGVVLRRLFERPEILPSSRLLFYDVCKKASPVSNGDGRGPERSPETRFCGRAMSGRGRSDCSFCQSIGRPPLDFRGLRKYCRRAILCSFYLALHVCVCREALSGLIEILPTALSFSPSPKPKIY